MQRRVTTGKILIRPDYLKDASNSFVIHGHGKTSWPGEGQLFKGYIRSKEDRDKDKTDYIAYKGDGTHGGDEIVNRSIMEDHLKDENYAKKNTSNTFGNVPNTFKGNTFIEGRLGAKGKLEVSGNAEFEKDVLIEKTATSGKEAVNFERWPTMSRTTSMAAILMNTEAVWRHNDRRH